MGVQHQARDRMHQHALPESRPAARAAFQIHGRLHVHERQRHKLGDAAAAAAAAGRLLLLSLLLLMLLLLLSGLLLLLLLHACRALRLGLLLVGGSRRRLISGGERVGLGRECAQQQQVARP